MSASDPEANRDVQVEHSSSLSIATGTGSSSVNLQPFLSEFQHRINSNSNSNVSSSGLQGLVGNPINGAGGAGQTPAPNANQPAIDLVKMVLPSLPFLLLLALKFLFDHKVGLLLFLCLAMLFAKCNEGVVSLITKSRAASSNQPTTNLFCSYRIKAAGLCTVCLTVLFLVLYVFQEQSLWLSLLCMPPTMPSYGFWALMFTVTVTDMLLKFAVMSVKLAALCLLSNRLNCVAMTRIYLITERFYQLYRQFAPIGIWYATLVSGRGPESSRVYTALLVLAYAIFKVHSLYMSALPMAKILSNLIRHPILFGDSFNSSTVKIDESSECPICQESVRDPIRLSCQHAFCLDCLLRWLAQSRTCPMCRQAVTPPEGGQDALAWLDGSTQANLQFY